MAYCTKCGATLNGPFCADCGTPARASAADTPAAGTPAATGSGAPETSPPQRRKTSPLVWVLIVLAGLFVLGGIATVGAGLFIANKVRQAGIDPELMKRNPGYAAAKLLMAAHPDLVEVRHDDDAGTITVRDRRTGKETTINFDDLRNGRFSLSADSDTGGTARVEIGGGSNVKLPSWMPEYPGSAGKAAYSVRAEGTQEGEGGSYAFTTADSAAAVLSFYREEAEKLGMKAEDTANSADGGTFTARDEAHERSFTVIVGRSGAGTTVNVSYGVKP